MAASFISLFLKKALEQLDAAVPDAEEDVSYKPDRTLTIVPTIGPQAVGLSLEESFDTSTLVLLQTPQKPYYNVTLKNQANATPTKRLEQVTNKGISMYNDLIVFLNERKLWNTVLKAADFDRDNTPVNAAAVLIKPDEQLLEDLSEIDRVLQVYPGLLLSTNVFRFI